MTSMLVVRRCRLSTVKNSVSLEPRCVEVGVIIGRVCVICGHVVCVHVIADHVIVYHVIIVAGVRVGDAHF